MSKLKNKWLENGEIIVVLLLVEVLKKLVLLLKKTYGYQERDELEIEEFMLKLNQIDNTFVVYLI